MKMLTRGVSAFIAALAVSHAMAVHVNPDGAGQVLIYPYYTVQQSEGNEFNTYVSVVNGSAVQAKALRLRFREGRNGREVAGFNLLLGPRDAWTGAVVPTPVGARLLSTDGSCMTPALATDLGPQVPPYVDFSVADFTGVRDDGHGSESQRVREGYVEVFEMAAFDVAPGCAQFQAASFPTTMLRVPSGQLSGTLTLINVQSGLDFTVNAVALADASTSHYFRPPDDPYPDYTAVEMSTVATFFRDGRLYRAGWATPLEAVNLALLADHAENELVMDRNTRSATDVVVTFPTRRLGGPDAPFSFQPGSNRDIEFNIRYWSREGAPRELIYECPNLCAPGSVADLRLRFSSSVVSLRPTASDTSAGAGTSDVFGSANGWVINMQDAPENGYLSLQFNNGIMETGFPFVHARVDLQTGISTPSGTTRYYGLPMVGFMARTFRNGTLQCAGAAVCQGNYGGAFPSRMIRNGTP